jgi:ribosome-binding protein aMBF1 (putative translation factor)
MEKNKQKRTYEIMFCKQCGKEMKVRRDYSKKHSGVCPSCQRKVEKHALKHGDCRTRLYSIWANLKNRKYKHKPDVCESWRKYEPFKKWALENGYSDNLTIDRIDNDKGYYPENCQWITLQENAGKDKRLFTLEQKKDIYHARKQLKITQREMAKLLNVSRNTIQRLEKTIKEMESK